MLAGPIPETSSNAKNFNNGPKSASCIIAKILGFYSINGSWLMCMLQYNGVSVKLYLKKIVPIDRFNSLNYAGFVKGELSTCMRLKVKREFV